MMESQFLIIITLAIIFGFYMAWGIGANDVANAMGTSVGSGALTLRRAVILAAILEFSGAFLVGSHVSETVRQGIVEPSIFTGDGLSFMLGMLAALLAAGGIAAVVVVERVAGINHTFHHRCDCRLRCCLRWAVSSSLGQGRDDCRKLGHLATAEWNDFLLYIPAHTEIYFLRRETTAFGKKACPLPRVFRLFSFNTHTGFQGP